MEITEEVVYLRGKVAELSALVVELLKSNTDMLEESRRLGRGIGKVYRCKCGQASRGRGQSYCKSCHAAYIRAYRRRVPLTPDQKKKSTCRAYTKVLQSRGVLPAGVCEGCGDPRAQNHHHWGYDKPRWFIRFCKACHRAVHG